PTFAAQDPGTLALHLGSATGFRGLSDGMGKLTGVIAAARDVNRDGVDDIVVGDGAAERADLYRGGTDWSFRATADVSVQQFYGDILMDTTVSNAGPDTVRVRLV